MRTGRGACATTTLSHLARAVFLAGGFSRRGLRAARLGWLPVPAFWPGRFRFVRFPRFSFSSLWRLLKVALWLCAACWLCTSLGLFDARCRIIVPVDGLGGTMACGFCRFNGGRSSRIRGTRFSIFRRRAVPAWATIKFRRTCKTGEFRAAFYGHFRADGVDEFLCGAFADFNQRRVWLNADGSDVFARQVTQLAQHRQDATRLS